MDEPLTRREGTPLHAATVRSRGRDRVAEILAQPDMLSAEDFAKHLGTTRATINTKRVGKQVLGLQGATRGYRYPAWQIDEEGRPFQVAGQSGRQLYLWRSLRHDGRRRHRRI
ncbi:hypothetical protein WBP06_27365 [Novosphingobium sp. BL-8H]|uniref:hypothetical protein n=1 Tax=Novosphingobium sp. BL-8H TaxID=3127640 RepID=UPI00375697D7